MTNLDDPGTCIDTHKKPVPRAAGQPAKTTQKAWICANKPEAVNATVQRRLRGLRPIVQNRDLTPGPARCTAVI